MSQDSSEVEKWSLGKLLSHLQVGTIWSLCITLAGLLAGSFVLGVRVERWLPQAQPAPVALPISAPWQIYDDLFPDDLYAVASQTLWSSEWSMQQQGKRGVLQGRLWLLVDDYGVGRGVFIRNADNAPPGALRGSLEPGGRKMRGTWINELGQTGKFIFSLSRDGHQFSGLYSIDGSTPTNTSNTWQGQRESAFKGESPNAGALPDS